MFDMFIPNLYVAQTVYFIPPANGKNHFVIKTKTFLHSQMCKHINNRFFELVSIISYILGVFLEYFKLINKGSPGVKNPEIMEMLGFGPSNNKIGILLNQN